jgi:hypothetical protein
MQNQPEDAGAAFQVSRIDPNDLGTNVNLGQLHAQQRKYSEAIVALRTLSDEFSGHNLHTTNK